MKKCKNDVTKNTCDFVNNENLFLVSIFIFSFIIRLVAIFYLKHYLNPLVWENGGIADNILAGKGFSIGFLGPEGPTSWQAPFYPYLLAFFYAFMGKGYLTYLCIEILQSLIMSLIPVFLYKSAKIIFNPEVAILTAIVSSLFPLTIWYATRIHHTAFTFFFISLAFYLFLKSFEAENKKYFILVGFVVGLGVLIEPVIIMLFLAFSVWAGIQRGFLYSIKKNTIPLLIIILIISPWTFRNYRIHGKLIFIKSSFGKEFWMGNNPHATGTSFAEGGNDEITNVYPPVIYDELKKYPELTRNKLLQNEALQWIRNNPLDFISLILKKVLYFWWYPPDNLVRHSGEGEAIKYALIKKLYWGGMLILFLYGIIQGVKNKNKYVMLMLLICIFHSMVYILTHVGQMRFRGVIEPIILIYVMYGALCLWVWCKSKIMEPILLYKNESSNIS